MYWDAFGQRSWFRGSKEETTKFEFEPVSLESHSSLLQQIAVQYYMNSNSTRRDFNSFAFLYFPKFQHHSICNWNKYIAF